MKKMFLVLVLLSFAHVGFSQLFSAKYFDPGSLLAQGKGVLGLDNRNLVVYGRNISSGGPLSQQAYPFLILTDTNGRVVASRYIELPAEDIAAVKISGNKIVVAILYRDDPAAADEHLMVIGLDGGLNVLWSTQKDFDLEVKPATAKIPGYNVSIAVSRKEEGEHLYITHPVNNDRIPQQVDCDVIKMDRNGTILWDNMYELHNGNGDAYNLPTTVALSDDANTIMAGGVNHDFFAGIDPRPFYFVLDSTGAVMLDHIFLITQASQAAVSGYTVPNVEIAYNPLDDKFVMAINEDKTSLGFGSTTAESGISLVDIIGLFPTYSKYYFSDLTSPSAVSSRAFNTGFSWSWHHKSYVMHGYKTGLSSLNAPIAPIEFLSIVKTSLDEQASVGLTYDVVNNYLSKTYTDVFGNTFCGAPSQRIGGTPPAPSFYFRMSKVDASLYNPCFSDPTPFKVQDQYVSYTTDFTLPIASDPFQERDIEMQVVLYPDELCPSQVSYRPAAAESANSNTATGIYVGKVMVAIPAGDAIASYRVVDMSGRIILSGNGQLLSENKMALENLPNGLYIVNLITQKGRPVSQRVLISN